MRLRWFTCKFLLDTRVSEANSTVYIRAHFNALGVRISNFTDSLNSAQRSHRTRRWIRAIFSARVELRFERAIRARSRTPNSPRFRTCSFPLRRGAHRSLVCRDERLRVRRAVDEDDCFSRESRRLSGASCCCTTCGAALPASRRGGKKKK